MDLLLWILAVILVVAGIFALFRRQLLWGIVLIIVGLLVGPGGVSLFNLRRTTRAGDPGPHTLHPSDPARGRHRGPPTGGPSWRPRSR